MDTNNIFDRNNDGKINNNGIITSNTEGNMSAQNIHRYSSVKIIFNVMNVIYIIAFGVALALNYMWTMFGGEEYLIQIIFGVITFFVFILSQILWQKTNKQIWMWIGIIFGVALAPVLMWMFEMI